MSPEADQIMKSKMATVCEEEIETEQDGVDRPVSLDEAREKYVETDKFDYDIVDFEEDVWWILQKERQGELETWKTMKQADSTGPLGQFMSAFMCSMGDVMRCTTDMVQQTYDSAESGVNVTVEQSGELLSQLATAMGMKRKAGESDEELRDRLRNEISTDTGRISPIKLNPERTHVHHDRKVNDGRVSKETHSVVHVVETEIVADPHTYEKLRLKDDITVYLDGTIYEDGCVTCIDKAMGRIKVTMEFGRKMANSPRYDTYSPGLEA